MIIHLADGRLGLPWWGGREAGGVLGVGQLSDSVRRH